MHLFCSFPTLGCSLEMPKDELPNHNCIKHLRTVVQQQQTRIAELEKASAEHKHQLAEQVGAGQRRCIPPANDRLAVSSSASSGPVGLCFELGKQVDPEPAAQRGVPLELSLRDFVCSGHLCLLVSSVLKF